VSTLLHGTNHGELIQHLTAYAVRVFAEFGLTGSGAVLPGHGLSAEDFASEVLIEYITGKIKVKEVPYLCTALRNNIIDKLRSAAQKTTSHVLMNADGNENEHAVKALDGFESADTRIDVILCEESYKQRVRSCVEDEPKLKEIIEAVFDLGLLKPDEIAEVIGVPVKEIYARKKKLARRLIKHGLKAVTS
jgi:DNA-directed RNA polymerase specialized sigma24 family protein